MPVDLSLFTGFEWDAGNDSKNWSKHRVSTVECEEVSFNRPLLVHFDGHSEEEDRYFVLGRTNDGRRLFLVFTPRGDQIRVISARDMTKKERSYYPA